MLSRLIKFNEMHKKPHTWNSQALKILQPELSTLINCLYYISVMGINRLTGSMNSSNNQQWGSSVTIYRRTQRWFITHYQQRVTEIWAY